MAELALPIDGEKLGATLARPTAAHGLVIFAHGSGSSRRSPRNRLVAKALNEHGFATLLLDLLSDAEEEHDVRTGALRFDIPLLARRVELATQWTREDARLSLLPPAYFGASTGAAAALLAAGARDDIAAVVSRGGRPDLAETALPHVRSATLLIVGERDPVVLDLNRKAAAQVRNAPCEIAIIPGAGHLFEEPQALESVARLAREWFLRYLTR